MSSKEELLEKLKVQYEYEKLARDTYLSYTRRIPDKGLITRLNTIIADEVEHMRIVSDLISFVNAIEGIAGNPDESDFIIDFGGNSAILMVSPVDKYAHRLLSAIGGLGGKRDVLYISFSKIPKFMKGLLSSKGIDTSRIKFIACVEGEVEDSSVVSPKDLTQLSIEMSSQISKMTSPVVIIDTLSGFSVYHTPEIITKFISVVNNKARSGGYGVLWVGLESPGDKRLNELAAQMCDKVIDI